MKKVKSSQILVFVLLAVLMLAVLSCSSADIPDSTDLSDSSDSLGQPSQTDESNQFSQTNQSDQTYQTSPTDQTDLYGRDDAIVKDKEGNASESGEDQGNGNNGKKSLTCTYSISCATIFDNLDKISDAVLGLQPKDGWILFPKEIEFQEGESVFDILLGLTRQEKIHMEFNSNPALNSKYVEGINNLYEFDVGELSGWTYKINGKGMGYGSSSSYPKDGDIIEWLYTCDQGRDLGFEP